MTLEEVKTKVRKLFRLAHDKGATEGEAEAAAAKAQELLDAHKLTQLDVPEAGEEREQTVHGVYPQGKRVPHWRRVLRRACADTTYCFSVYGEDAWHLFGKPTDAAVCRELYAFLAEQVDKMGAAYTKGGAVYGYAHRNGTAFRIGCASRVGGRLREAFAARQAAHGQSTALVLYNESAAAKALSRIVFPHQSTARGQQVRNAAWADGNKAGDGVRLNVERKLADRGALRITHQG